MIRTRILAATAIVAVSALTWTGFVAADDAAPTAPAAEAPKAAPAPATTEAPKVADADAPKTSSPIHSLMGWVAKQVAPDAKCGCPSSADGEKAWRAWFAGGADVPLASLRDTLVSQGWTADRTITFFKEMAASKGECKDGKCADGKCADGKCADGKCADGGCCKGKGERADGKPCCGGCKNKDQAKTEPAPAPAAPAPKPEEAPAKP